MDLPDLRPLAGGMSGETFLSDLAGERAVVRIYAGRSAARGPAAAELDAAVLAWVRGIVPVPRVLEVRPGDPASGMPALLVTSFLPGVLLENLLPTLDERGLARVGRSLGTLLGRLAHVALPREGLFADPDLTVQPFDEQSVPDLGWRDDDHRALLDVLADARTLLDTVERACLVHSDLNPKNVLVDADQLVVTGVLDWEYAHAGSPYADLGNLLRFDRAPAYVDAVLAAREAFVPDPRPHALDLARAADLVALIDLASRRTANPIASRAHDLLLAIARTGDLHAT